MSSPAYHVASLDTRDHITPHRHSIIAQTVAYLLIILGTTWAYHALGQSGATVAVYVALCATIVTAEQWHLIGTPHVTSSPVSTAACLAFALYLPPTLTPSDDTYLTALALISLSLLIGTVIRLTHDGLSPRPVLTFDTVLPDVLTRGCTAVAALTALHYLPNPTHTSLAHHLASLTTVPALAAAGALMLVVLSLAASARIIRHQRHATVSRRDVLDSIPLYGAIAGAAVITAAAVPTVGPLAIPAVLLPLVLAHLAHQRQHNMNRTYDQAIRAMARTGELTGHLPHGHTHVVSRLAVAIGAQLSLSESELATVERGALLHDVAHPRLADPLPHGNTTHLPLADQHYLAYHSARAARFCGFPDQLDRILAAVTTPWHNPHPELLTPKEAHIIRVANVVDDIARTHPGPDKAALEAALEELYRGIGYVYDPRVVTALAEIARTAPHILPHHHLHAAADESAHPQPATV